MHHRPNDINLNFGISNKEGKLKFREYKGIHGLSTFSELSKADYDNLAKTDPRYQDFVETEVEIKTLKNALSSLNVPETIHFMKVDVEGYEYEVLSGNDWDKYRPQVICIEANHIKNDWRPMLAKNKYTFVFFDGLNDYYVANEAKEVKERFSYIETLLPTPILDYRAVGIVEYYKNEKLKADAKNVDINNELYVLKHELYVAEEQLRELSRLRGLIKGLFKKFDFIIEDIILPHAYRGDVCPDPVSGTPLSLSPGSNSSDILKNIQRYDESLRGLNPPEYKVRYKLLYFYRKYIYRTLKSFASLCKRIIKKIVKVVRKIV